MRAALLLVLLLASVAEAGPARERGRGRGRSLGNAGLTITWTASGNCSGAAQTFSDGTPITWTRATSATCTKNDGTLTTLASNQPRTNSTGGQVEPPATNLCIQSQTMELAAWNPASSGAGVTNAVRTANAALAPDGTMTAEQFDFPAVGAAAYSLMDSSGMTVTSSTTYTGSLYVRTVSGTAPIHFIAPGGVLRATMNATTTWQRFSYTQTTGGAEVLVTMRFGFDTRSGISTSPASSFYVWGAQYELGSVATSYIPTVATAVVRNADVPTVTLPAWMTDTAGCASATATIASNAPVGTATRWLALGATNTLIHTGSAIATVGVTDGTNSAFFAKTLLGNTTTLRSYWSSAGLGITDGTATNLASYDGSILASSTLTFGSTGSGNYMTGYLNNVKLGSKSTGCQ